MLYAMIDQSDLLAPAITVSDDIHKNMSLIRYAREEA